jgi:hypothetical protein
MSDAAHGKAVPWGWLWFGLAALVLAGIALGMFMTNIASGFAESAFIMDNARNAIATTEQIIRKWGIMIFGGIAIAIALAWWIRSAK